MIFLVKYQLLLRHYCRVHCYPLFLKSKLLLTSIIQFGRWKCAPKLSKDMFESGIYNNAEVHSAYGGAVISQSNELILGICSFPWGEALHPARTTLFLNFKIRSLDKALYLLTPEAEGNFYHWMIDSIGRLGLVDDFKKLQYNYKKVILHSKAQKYEDECLWKLGYDSENFLRLDPKDRAKVDELFIPPKRLPRDLPRVVNFLRSTFSDVMNSCSEASKSHPRILWVSRRRAFKRRLKNEDFVLHKLSAEFDVQTIEMEVLSLESQIKLASSADLLIGVHGAAFSLCSFMSPGSKLVEIANPLCRQDFYSDLCSVTNLEYDFISGQIDSLNYSISQQRDLRWGNQMDLVLNQQGISDLLYIMHNSTYGKKNRTTTN